MSVGTSYTKLNELVYVLFANFNIFKELFVTYQLFLCYPLHKKRGQGAEVNFIVLLKGAKNRYVNFEEHLYGSDINYSLIIATSGKIKLRNLFPVL